MPLNFLYTTFDNNSKKISHDLIKDAIFSNNNSLKTKVLIYIANNELKEFKGLVMNSLEIDINKNEINYGKIVLFINTLNKLVVNDYEGDHKDKKKIKDWLDELKKEAKKPDLEM